MSVKKVFLSSVASLLMAAFISPVSICAKSTPNFDTIQRMAENAPSYVLGRNKGWNNTSAFNIKPLYDFNNKLIAYSVDIKNKDNDENAYAIMGQSEYNAPVLEFCPGHLSPYDTINSDQKCIYDQETCYYSKDSSGNTFYDLKSHSKLSNECVNYLISESKIKKHVSSKPSISKSERAKLSVKNDKTGISVNSAQSSKIINNVPDYAWRDGCAPTATAMVLKYTYYLPLYNVSYVTLIDQLANAMGTRSNGWTATDEIPEGIRTVMRDHGLSVATWNDYDGYGRDGNTYQELCNEINNDHPVIINLYNSKWNDHSVAGIGYQRTSSYSYVVVHDTYVQGDVYINYDSSDFGTPWFTYVH